MAWRRNGTRVLWVAGVGSLTALFAVALPHLIWAGRSAGGRTILETVHVEFNVAAWVRDAPLSSAGKIAILGSNTPVMVACLAHGEEVMFGAKTSDLWAFLWKPAVGFISDALLQTPSNGPPVGECSDPPSRPPGATGSLGRLVELDGASTAVRARPATGSDVVVSLELGSSVMVNCEVDGEVASRNGSTSTLWARTTQPFAGYVSELFVAGGIGGLPNC